MATLLAGVIGSGLAAPRAAVQAQPHPVLLTGDAVIRFGHVGQGGFRVVGILDDGRVAILGSLSDGRRGLFLAGDGRTSVLWLPDSPADAPTPLAFSVSGGGGVALRGDSGSSTAVYRVANGDLVELVRDGSFDQHGDPLCVLRNARVNDLGRVAFVAEAAPGSTTCPKPDLSSVDAIYIAGDEGVRRVVGTGPLAPPGSTFEQLSLIGFGRDDTVVFSVAASGGEAIFRARGEVIDQLVGVGSRSPAGVPLVKVQALAANAVGEVLFAATAAGDRGLYRSAGGAIVEVGPRSDLALAELSHREVAAMNDAGDVAVLAHWTEGGPGAGSQRVSGLVLYPASGPSRVIVRTGLGTPYGAFYFGAYELVYLGNGGDVAFQGIVTHGGRSADAALQWTDGSITRVLHPGAPSPDGAFFVAGGITGAKCLAADGRVATEAVALDGTRGLLCADRDGFHAVAVSGDADPEGGEFRGFSTPDCTFLDDGGMIFTANKRVTVGGGPAGTQLSTEPAVYRTTPEGIVRLVGTGDATAEGLRWAPTGTSIRYSANSSGDVVVYGRDGRTFGWFLRRGAELRRLEFRLDEIDGVRGRLVGVSSVSLADTGDIVMLGRFVPSSSSVGSLGSNVLLRWSEDALRAVVTATDIAADGEPYGYFLSLHVRGRWALFQGSVSTLESRMFLYDLAADGGPRLIFADTPRGPPPRPPGALFGSGPLDLSRGGRVLMQAYEVGTSLASSYLLEAGEQPRLLYRPESELRPFALNDGGTVASLSSSVPPGSSRAALLLDGPGATDVPCPVPPTLVTRTPTITPTPTQTPTPTRRPCAGDCFGLFQVSRGNLLTGIRIALGRTGLPACRNADTNRDGRVTVDELVLAVLRFRETCPD